MILQAGYTRPIALDSWEMNLKECELVSPQDAEPRDLKSAYIMLREGVVKVSDLITAIKKPQEAKSAYKGLIENPGKHLTIIFDWRK